MPIQDITVQLLENFKAYLFETRSIGEPTIINHLMVIRTIYSMAMKEDPELISKYPFGRGKVKIKFPESVKIGLSSEEVIRLETAELNQFSRIV